MIRILYVTVRNWLIAPVIPLALGAGYASAIEYQTAEDIEPETAERAAVGVPDVQDSRVNLPRRRVIRDILADRSPFFSDSSLYLGVRAYDLRRDDDGERVAEGLAAGTELTYRSGVWRDRLSTVVSWHTSYAVDAPDDSGDTGLLGPGQDDLSVLSRAWLQVEMADKLALRLYRQDFNMPYINRHDIRMIPITHEAYMLRYPGERFQWNVGHVSKVKLRDSEEFVPMAEAAGIEGSDDGTSVAVARWNFEDEASIAALIQHTRDAFTTSYVEGVLPRTFDNGVGLQLAAQYTDQRANGRESLGDFQTYNAGVRAKVSYRGAILTAAWSGTGSARIQKPFGASPSYNTTMLFDFDRANEQATQLAFSYNLGGLALPGASVTANYVWGNGAESEEGRRLADTDVSSLTVDFRPERSWLKGAWLRLRYAERDRGGSERKRREVRVIFNYSLEGL